MHRKYIFHLLTCDNFALRAIFNCVEIIPRQHRICLISLCDWFRKLAPLSHPIRFKFLKTNHDLVTRVFPRFGQFTCIYFNFLLALKVSFLLIGFCNFLVLARNAVSYKYIVTSPYLQPVLGRNPGSSPRLDLRDGLFILTHSKSQGTQSFLQHELSSQFVCFFQLNSPGISPCFKILMLRLCLPERDCTVKRMMQKITKRNLYSLQRFDQHSEAVCIHAVVLVQRRRYSCLANYP